MSYEGFGHCLAGRQNVNICRNSWFFRQAMQSCLLYWQMRGSAKRFSSPPAPPGPAGPAVGVGGGGRLDGGGGGFDGRLE